ncbi:acetylornithine deacetylase [Cereibacter azotoformans]|uniref:Acetylornithine deacetylase n=1 Tax=Cereibacter azotoformans TaxID=43057 RepID=A0A2T5KD98_9RHOB|nr:acetylornithine deacetylase [Cereibacter azotoformans]AXQ93605.1 acetylornithine deacetylase [Cereibacter sphaeroides]MBO4168626.1 acetylornithine deacetylase [Cereibacter azotoformans]PTR20384.1 acetylornithine deacetylase [Cereibacter azotoformans]UIJ31942.1 acetylornithine deacetylase [Cereibacter azotoformans]
MPSPLTPRQILERLVAFPTVSRDSNLALVDWVEEFLDERGIAAHRVWNADRTKAALYAHVGPEVEGAVVLSGHSDVVPVEGQDWSSDPWTLTERDGRLYGRGTCDMKGFDALALAALALAQERGVKRPLQLALSFDEEVGCLGAPAMIEEMARCLPKGRAVIVGEPSRMRVVTGHKGGGGLLCHVQGHEVHSSIMHRGVNAIMSAARLIDWANRRNAEGAAGPPSEVAALFDPPWTTVHVGTIRGGTAGNITARDCRFDVGFRAVPGETVEDWAAAFEAEARSVEAEMKAIHPEAAISIGRLFGYPPLRPEEGGEAEALARRLTGDNGSMVVSYGTEAGQFQAAGYSAVVCGPGDIAQAHQPDEYLEVAQFEDGWSFMRRLVEECAG